MSAPAEPAAAERPSLVQRAVLPLLALLLVAAAGAADYGLAARGFSLPLVYLLPLAVLVFFAGWPLILASLLISAGLNFVVDIALAARFANPTLVHLVNTAFFAALLLLSRAAYVGRMMLTYFARGQLWRTTYKPARLGQRFVVVPTWLQESYASDASAPRAEITLIMDPGKAFGTGSHPTTQMCIALLEENVQPGDRLLDLGCGSGILSIAAARLGAGAVLGLDIDPEAVRATAANAAANSAGERVEARLGSLASILPVDRAGEPPQFQIVVANVLTDVILAALDNGLARTLAPGGLLVLSGIKAEEAARVEAAVNAAGLALVERRQGGKWIALAARHNIKETL